MKKKEEKQVNNICALINKLKTNKKVDKDMINDARIMYESLNDEQKSHVYNKKDLEDLEKKFLAKDGITLEERNLRDIVDNQIVLSLKTVNDEILDLDLKKECVLYTFNLYNSLNENLKIMLKNANCLEEINQIITKLELIAKHKELAAEVIKLIDELPLDVTLSEEGMVNEANEAYINLVDDAKKYVTNYEKLLNLLSVIESIKNAMVVVEAIDAIKTRVTLEDEERINEALVMYENLNNNEKVYVTNYAKLIELNNVIKELKQAQADKKSASNMDKQISLLHSLVTDDNVSLANKLEQYNLVLGIYESLSESIKDYMENKDLFVKTSEILDDLILEDKRKGLAKAIFVEINSIPYHIEATHLNYLNEIDSRYINLDADLKKLVTNYDVLTKAIAVSTNKNKALDVTSIINSIEINYDRKLVLKANEAYNSLDPEARGYVFNYNELVHYMNNMNYYEFMVKKANKLNEEIKAFKVSSLDDEKDLLIYKSEYESLDSLVLNYVTHAHILTEEQNKIKRLRGIKTLEEKISLLPNPIKYVHKSVIIDLMNEAKDFDFVSDKLNKAHQEIDKMEDLIINVEHLIDEIGDVEIHEGDDIARARMAYEMLDEDLKIHVSNYERILDMEREFIKLESQTEDVNDEINSYIDEQILLLSEMCNDDGIENSKRIEYLKYVLKLYENRNDMVVHNSKILLEIKSQYLPVD